MIQTCGDLDFPPVYNFRLALLPRRSHGPGSPCPSSDGEILAREQGHLAHCSLLECTTSVHGLISVQHHVVRVRVSVRELKR